MHLPAIWHSPLGRRLQWASFNVGFLHKRQLRDFIELGRFVLIASVVIVGSTLGVVALLLHVFAPSTELGVENRPVLWLALSIGTATFLALVAHGLAALIRMSMLDFAAAVYAAVAEHEKEFFEEIERELFDAVDES